MSTSTSPARGVDRVRYPTLTAAGQAVLDFLREHPAAPIYRNQSGNRLSEEDLATVLAFERRVADATVCWHRQRPVWRDDFVARALREVPHYRSYGDVERFEDLPTIDRGDLSRDVAQFVPDSVAVERLMHFSTSGTTGHPLLIPSHPVVAAHYLAFHKRALARWGIELRHGAGQVGVVLLGHQRTCFTYVSVTPSMGESALAKINLHPVDWRHPDDRATYLDALAPEVIAGDPLSFEVLADLPLRHCPRALLSTAMTLWPAQRLRLEERFGCPVLDLYSMNEAGPIAVGDPGVGDPREGGHVLLQPGLYVEILADDGEVLPPGERGEITLTGGFNFCLPLVRYRTGDTAALDLRGPTPLLVGLEGRPPVVFRSAHGEVFNNLEVTHALAPHALAQFTLHQDRGGAVRMRYRGAARPEEVRRVLAGLFGALPLQIEADALFEGKTVQYTCEAEEILKC